MSCSSNDLVITHVKMCDILASVEVVTFDKERNLVKFDMESTWEMIKKSNTSSEISIAMLIT